jgi:nucleotide-binding universal stress UspA family protein
MGAALNQVDLIVMGGYRHTVAMEWLVGSTADQVLCTSPLPVLIT